MEGIRRYLWRVGHMWVENPVWLVRFGWRLIVGVPYALHTLGAPGRSAVVGRIARQTLKTGIRGAAPVVVLGVAGGFGIGALTRGTGILLQPFVDQTFMTLIVRDVVPLALAVTIAARTGAAVAGRFATAPALAHQSRVRYSASELQRTVWYHLLAAAITAVPFYLVTAGCLIAGYRSGGMVTGALAAHFPPLETLVTPGSAFFAGVGRTVLFAVIVVYTAAAFGVQAAERFVSDAEDTHDVHYATWESTSVSVILCTALTFALWEPL